ncbi:MAG: pseudouridine synthase [Kyrpidia sp.]|nr:pseudouridine synthase [Kyrpidia sp.]
MKARLQKVIAGAGLTSRRKAEMWIAEGRVRVNGQVVSEPGCKVDPAVDRIEVDGRPLRMRDRAVCFLFYKPAGVVTTMHDPQGRPTVADYVRDIPQRVFPVGRLDANSSGLLILTNDGALAHRLMHPRFGVEKTYRVKVAGYLDDRAVRSLENGIVLDGVRTASARVRIRTRQSEGSEFDITLHEGRNRQVRRMCRAVGHPVRELTRIRYGNLTVDGLRPGQIRPLSEEEDRALRALVRVKPGRG